jgi:hypothetical protein
MKVPISETTFAVSRLRNVGDRKGRQRLVDGPLDEFGNGSPLAFLSYQQSAESRKIPAEIGLSWRDGARLVVAQVSALVVVAIETIEAQLLLSSQLRMLNLARNLNRCCALSTAGADTRVP